MDNQAPMLEEYKGNCHCGAFKFTLKILEIKKVYLCSCSICIRKGYMWIFPVAEESITIDSGEGTLRGYEFGAKTRTHFFCPKCGSSVMARKHEASPGGAIGINARVLKDINLETLEIIKINGGDQQAKYEPASLLLTWQGEVEHGLSTYTGNCHCGAVAYAVKTKPFTESKVMSCNCSLCSRNGDLWIYPPRSAVQLHGAENLVDYVFLDRESLHSFCGTCGVSVVVKVTVPGEDVVPLNVRIIQGVDLESLEYEMYDGRRNDPQYSV